MDTAMSVVSKVDDFDIVKSLKFRLENILFDSDVDEDNPSTDCDDGDEKNDNAEYFNRGVDVLTFTVEGEGDNSVESRGDEVIFVTTSITDVFLMVSGNDNGDDGDGVVRSDIDAVEKNDASAVDFAVNIGVTDDETDINSSADSDDTFRDDDNGTT